MKMYVVRVEIREAATRYSYPIVIHEFAGKTKEEAWGYHDAHRQADSFLRQCEDKRMFNDTVACQSMIFEGWRQVPVMPVK